MGLGMGPGGRQPDDSGDDYIDFRRRVFGPMGRPPRRRWRFVAMAATMFIAVLVAAMYAVMLFGGGGNQPSDARPTAGQQAAAAGQQTAEKPAAQAIIPCEPPESRRCREFRGEIPPEPEIQGLKIDFSSSGPSIVETFGWWMLAALILAGFIAALTRWTIQQTAPIAVGLVVTLLILQNWWIFFVVVGALLVLLVVTAIRNLLAGGVRGARNIGSGLPQAGASLLAGGVVWEMVQTLWTNRTIEEVRNRVAANQNQPPAQAPAQAPAQPPR